jgi:hypothetical protein
MGWPPEGLWTNGSFYMKIALVRTMTMQKSQMLTSLVSMVNERLEKGVKFFHATHRVVVEQDAANTAILG